MDLRGSPVHWIGALSTGRERTMHVGVRSLVAIAAFVGLAGSGAATSVAVTPALQTAPVVAGAPESGAGYDGVVQAVRQTVIAAQVSGAVVALDVKAGDVVKAGQVLLRLDSRSAEHAAAASAAQLRAAQATQQAAARDYERQKQLFEKRYISQAALDRAEELYKAATAQAAAQMATAMAAQTESGFYTVRAPYSGVVSDVPVVLGDMAMPGRPLLTLYDPGAMRVSVAVPQTVASRLRDAKGAEIELPNVASDRISRSPHSCCRRWMPQPIRRNCGSTCPTCHPCGPERSHAYGSAQPRLPWRLGCRYPRARWCDAQR